MTDAEKGVQPRYSGFRVQGAATSPPTHSFFIIQHFLPERNRFYNKMQAIFVVFAQIVDKRLKKGYTMFVVEL